MSDSKRSLKQQFQKANDLINAQKYDEARKLLRQINHPKAEEWLIQLEDKNKQSTPSTLFSPMMLGLGVGATILILGLVLAFMYVPTLIETLQPNTAEQYMDDTVVSDEEILYSHIASYCYHITGYGGELCLDWTDMMMAEYRDTAETCLASYMDAALFEDDDYVTIGACFAAASVPDPY